MDATKKWEEMTWQEKREERFKRWLNPPDVKFVSPEAEKLYKERVNRFIKAIKLEQPDDRVPVMLPTGNSPAYYAGANFRTIMYDYEKARDIWLKYMDDFGDMDTFSGPMLIPSGRISEALNARIHKLPGLGLPDDSPMNQFVEGEYMMADEYDLFMRDPTDYALRVNMPRTIGLFESFRKLPRPDFFMMGEAWVAALADPDIRRTFQTLMDLSGEYRQWRAAHEEVRNLVLARGYPSLFGGGIMAGAPFDHFGDVLRGTHGIFMDMFRQPQKLHEAMECQLNLLRASIKGFPMTPCPVCPMPLHKGDDTFMSDAQFEEFYWPTLRGLFLAMIDEGLVPMPFAEGKYTNRLKQINDTPRSGVVWWFDQTDMAKAKKILGDVCCIVGNVPTSLMMTGTTEQVRAYCRQLIEDCAPGGGYILAGGAHIDTDKVDNLHAMMDAAKEYGVYK
jgi:uroporphyrinogen-III decarboxylase